MSAVWKFAEQGDSKIEMMLMTESPAVVVAEGTCLESHTRDHTQADASKFSLRGYV